MKTIKLTPEQYKELERDMQWPEDLKAYEKLNKPTPITFSDLNMDEVEA